jgi:hypothetical protein
MLLVYNEVLFQGIQWPASQVSADTLFPLQSYIVSYSLKCVCIFTFTAHRNLYS